MPTQVDDTTERGADAAAEMSELRRKRMGTGADLYEKGKKRLGIFLFD